MKEYSTLIRAPEQEPHNQIQCSKSKVKLKTVVEGDPKAPFSIATTPRCRGGLYSIPWIAPFHP